MEDFNSKYTGQQVEDLLDQVASGNAGGGGGGGITVETDPIFSASPAATITEDDKSAWSGKQDAISDLATIRSGAEKGATAVQPGDIEDEVYITDFDTISLESLVQNREEGIVIDKQGLMDALARHKVILVPYAISDTAKGYCTLVGYYEDLLYIKVITGDYEIIVETSLNYPDIYYDEVTIRWWVDKQDALKSGENIKTINGESILGSGDIAVGGVSEDYVDNAIANAITNAINASY